MTISQSGARRLQLTGLLCILICGGNAAAQADPTADATPTETTDAAAAEGAQESAPEETAETEAAQPADGAVQVETVPIEGAETEPVAGVPGDSATTAPNAAPVDAAAEPAPPEPVSMARGPRKNLLLIGPGFGLGFIYPKEINDFLDVWTGSQSVDSGFTAMVLAFQPKVAITYGPIEYVQLQLVGEIGWAPKIFTVIGGDSEMFNFVRYTTGLNIAGHIPLGNGRKSLSFGAGALFNVLRFEDFSEIAPGVRGMVGFRFYGRKAFTPEIFLEYNWIRASTGAEGLDGMSGGIIDDAVITELNYSGVTIGANFYFKILEQ